MGVGTTCVQSLWQRHRITARIPFQQVTRRRCIHTTLVTDIWIGPKRSLEAKPRISRQYILVLSPVIVGRVRHIDTVETRLRAKLRGRQKLLDRDEFAAVGIQRSRLARVMKPGHARAANTYRLRKQWDQVRGNLQRGGVDRNTSVLEVVNKRVGLFISLRHAKIALQGGRLKGRNVLNIRVATGDAVRPVLQG